PWVARNSLTILWLWRGEGRSAGSHSRGILNTKDSESARVKRSHVKPKAFAGDRSVWLCSLHRAQDFEAKAFVRSQDAPMRFEFAQGRQRHAEIDGAEWTPANHAFAPPFGIANFLDLFARTRIEGDEPLVPANVAFRFG